MDQQPKDSAQRVQQAVHQLGYDFTVVEFDQSTRTSTDAATAIGCTVAQIAKSLVFRGKASKEAILIIASGVNRVDVKKVSRILGEKVSRADADFVREETGFAIGGIPPVGHKKKLITLIDEDLMQHQLVWAAAGTPHAVFRLTPEGLVKMTGGQVVSLAEKSD